MKAKEKLYGFFSIDDLDEKDFEVTMEFVKMLVLCTRDGAKKIAKGEKPSWKIDSWHEAGLFSHLNRWKHGEMRDPDSGAHPLVHAAWRALAIAWQESVSAKSKTIAFKRFKRLVLNDCTERDSRCTRVFPAQRKHWCKRCQETIR